jgi:preprotein translocase subunit SecA
MPTLTDQYQAIFDAGRLKQPELRPLDQFVHLIRGWVLNRWSNERELGRTIERVNRLESAIQPLSDRRFKDEITELMALARRRRLIGPALERALAVAREGVWRGVGKRLYDVQLMGALAIIRGAIAEMATGEGKTLTATVAAAIWGWSGKPVHVLTVNDYLVSRDASEMEPVYRQLGLAVGAVIHETEPNDRFAYYRRQVVYVTSKELVADFLRDRIRLGLLRIGLQASINALLTGGGEPLLIPGLHRAIVDEADSLLIDEAVTPLIISASPNDEPNAGLYTAARKLAQSLTLVDDFTIDREVKRVMLTEAGLERLEAISGQQGLWRGERRREELVCQALSAEHCFGRDEQYLVSADGKVQIIDEFTGRVMADRSWRNGLHQAVEIKEGVQVTAGKETMAQQSFQRFFRQYPLMGGMTGTGREAAAELWNIYGVTVVPIPTNRPCRREQLPIRFFDTTDEKYEAVVRRVIELNKTGAPVLVGTRSVLASEEISRRLVAAGRDHRVLNAAQNAEEATIVAEAGQRGRITVATNMAGRGTDIKLGRGVTELGGLHVIATEPHASHRVDRQLQGRAARQGDPGSAQLFASAEDDLFLHHLPQARTLRRAMRPERLIKLAQQQAERLARFNRTQVLKQDTWLDESLPF